MLLILSNILLRIVDRPNFFLLLSASIYADHASRLLTDFKIQLMTVSINSTKASNASLKKKVDDLRLERINYRETLQKALREEERRKAAVVRLNRLTTDTREQAEYVMREVGQVSTIIYLPRKSLLSSPTRNPPFTPPKPSTRS